MRLHDRAQLERAGGHDDAHQREPHENLVADHLADGSKAAQQGVLVVGRPTGEGDAVNGHRRHGEEEQQANVEVGDDDGTGKRNDREGHERGGDDDARSEDEDGFIGEAWDPVLLREDLDHVRDDLQKTKRPDTVRTVPLLPKREHAAFEPDQAGGHRQHRDQYAEDHDDVSNGFRHARVTSIRP